MNEDITQKITMISIKEAAELVNGLTKYRCALKTRSPTSWRAKSICSTKRSFSIIFVAKKNKQFCWFGRNSENAAFSVDFYHK